MDGPIENTVYLREQLERNRGQWKRVAQESGVPYKTIKNFMQRPNSYPRVPTLDKLLTYYRSGEAHSDARAS